MKNYKIVYKKKGQKEMVFYTIGSRVFEKVSRLFSEIVVPSGQFQYSFSKMGYKLKSIVEINSHGRPIKKQKSKIGGKS